MLFRSVEPNADMRGEAERDLKRFGKFVSLSGSAENTGIESGTVDNITVAQAFHWFDRNLFKKECGRILKADGKVVLVWNCRDEDDETFVKNAEVNKAFCPAFKGFTGGMGSKAGYDFSDFFSGDYDVKIFDNSIMLNVEQFIGRNLSSSYAPATDAENCSAYVDALKKLFSERSVNGLLKFPTFTRCYIGKV